MKKYFYLTLGLFISQISIAQTVKKDFVVCIDGEIAIHLCMPQIIIKQDTSVLNIDTSVLNIKIDYHAGNMSLKAEDYNTILKVLKALPYNVFLKFDHYQFSKWGKETIYNYELEMNRTWFESSFVVIYIENLDKKKNRRRWRGFDSGSTKHEYILNVITSEGQTITFPPSK